MKLSIITLSTKPLSIEDSALILVNVMTLIIMTVSKTHYGSQYNDSLCIDMQNNETQHNVIQHYG